MRDHSTRVRDHLGGARPLQRQNPLYFFLGTTTPRRGATTCPASSKSHSNFKLLPNCSCLLRGRPPLPYLRWCHGWISCLWSFLLWENHEKDRLNDCCFCKLMLGKLFVFQDYYSLFPSICFPIIKSQMLKCCCYQSHLQEMLKPYPQSYETLTPSKPFQNPSFPPMCHVQTLH